MKITIKEYITEEVIKEYLLLRNHVDFNKYLI